MGEGNISTIWIQCFGCTMFSLDGCCWLLLLLLSIFRWLLPVLLVDVGFQIKMKDGKLSGACGNLEIFFLFRVDSMWSLLPHPTPSLTWVSAMKNHCNPTESTQGHQQTAHSSVNSCFCKVGLVTLRRGLVKHEKVALIAE